MPAAAVSRKVKTTNYLRVTSPEKGFKKQSTVCIVQVLERSYVYTHAVSLQLEKRFKNKIMNSTYVLPAVMFIFRLACGNILKSCLCSL